MPKPLQRVRVRDFDAKSQEVFEAMLEAASSKLGGGGGMLPVEGVQFIADAALRLFAFCLAAGTTNPDRAVDQAIEVLPLLVQELREDMPPEERAQ